MTSLCRIDHLKLQTLLLLLSVLSTSHSLSPISRNAGFRPNPATMNLDQDELQVLKFIDPQSRRPIILVGCMHYNPESIKRASTVTKEVAKSSSSGSLYALLIESCETRYSEGMAFSKTLESKPLLKEIYQKTLNNEMRSACLVARDFERPIILGDRLIESTSERMTESFKQTVSDLRNPFDGGWNDISRDFEASLKVLKYSFGFSGSNDAKEPLGDTETKKDVLMLNPDYFDVKLGIGMLISFLRYPFSIALRYPMYAFGLIAFVKLISSSLEIDFGIDGDSAENLVSQTTDWILTFAFAGLEAIVLARVLIMPVLAERDVILADAIMAVANGRDVCSSKEDDGGKLMMVHDGEIMPFSSWLDSQNQTSDEINEISPSKEDNAVVAILGMAHCNGVRRLILESSALPKTSKL